MRRRQSSSHPTNSYANWQSNLANRVHDTTPSTKQLPPTVWLAKMHRQPCHSPGRQWSRWSLFDPSTPAARSRCTLWALAGPVRSGRRWQPCADRTISDTANTFGPECGRICARRRRSIGWTLRLRRNLKVGKVSGKICARLSHGCTELVVFVCAVGSKDCKSLKV